MIGQDQPARCGLGWAAKVIASGVYLTQRQPLEILRASCAWMTAPDAVMRHALATRDPSAIFALKVEIDHDPIQRMVTLRTAHDGELVSASARFFPDVGACVVDAADPTLKFTPIAHDFAQVADTAPLPPATHLSAAQQAAIDQAGTLMFAKAAQFTNAFVVLHRGRTVFERYSPSFGPQTRFESWSMGKSIAASLIGVLEQRGALALAEPTGLAEWQQRGDPRAAIRIADLLNMASGLQFTGSYSDGEDPATKSVDGRFLDHLYVYAGGIDSVGFSLAKPLEAPPGTLGRYRNCDPLLATAVARRHSDAPDPAAFLHWPMHALFAPIGAYGMVIEPDPFGHLLISGHDYGRARDWARLGQLYLQRGAWEGNQLLRERFVEFVQTPSAAWGQVPYYGGFFITNATAIVPTLPRDAYWMSGGGGQRVFVVPSLDLVVVRMGHLAGEIFGRQETMVEALGQIAQALGHAPVAHAPAAARA